MSCKNCKDHPIDAHFRWHNGTIRIVACELHWNQVRNVLQTVEHLAGYALDPSETVNYLGTIQWDKTLPESDRDMFLRMCTDFGALASMYLQLKEAMSDTTIRTIYRVKEDKTDGD